MVTSFKLLLGYMWDCFRSHERLKAEILILRHQLNILHRKAPKRLRIATEEIAAMRKTVLTGYQKEWPPAPPEQDCGVSYCGFPGGGTIWLSLQEISFGAVPGTGVASSVSETDVSSLIEREHLMDVLGTGLPPENYDFGGMSGGPMLTLVEDRRLRSWRLAGVIYNSQRVGWTQASRLPTMSEADVGLERCAIMAMLSTRQARAGKAEG
jgi:hypothetical protein